MTLTRRFLIRSGSRARAQSPTAPASRQVPDATLAGLPPAPVHRILACAAVLLLSLCSAASALARPTPRVPQSFVGVALDGPMFPVDPSIDLAQQLDVMVASGVESLRFEIDWADAQPYASWDDVPDAERSQFTNVDGLPLRLGQIDQLVSLAAARGLSMRPDVLDAPAWDAILPAGAAARTPESLPPYGTFLKALIHRYGPHGSLWTGRSASGAIRMWQIWNEPNLVGYWAHQPNFEPSYVDLLRTAHAAIKQADPGAQVILAGMVNVSWKFIARIYKVHGARSLFDVVGVHPYTRYPAGVATILGNVRRVMDHAGDTRKPILADEVGWNSSLHKSPDHFGVEVTEALQAANIHAAMGIIAARRQRLRLIGFDLYNWAGVETPGSYEFNFAGLFRFTGSSLVAKPSYRTFRRDALALERCRRKASATRCTQPG